MIFITQGCYTRDALAGMIAAPEDRAREAKRLIESAGGKFIASYFTLGAFDFMVISEFDGIASVTPALIAAAAGGSLSSMQTTVAMSWSDGREAFAGAAKLAKAFKSAGKGKK